MQLLAELLAFEKTAWLRYIRARNGSNIGLIVTTPLWMRVTLYIYVLDPLLLPRPFSSRNHAIERLCICSQEEKAT